MTEKREILVEQLEKTKEITNKANTLVEIGERLLKKFPDLRERFYLSTFCKTSYFGDIDWEIIVKAVEPPIYGFEKRERFPVCILRFLLDRTITLVRPFVSGDRGRELVFEASLSDIDKIIGTLSDIRNKMQEVSKDLALEVEK